MDKHEEEMASSALVPPVKAVCSPQILWVGCGDLLRRTMAAITELKDSCDADFTFIDVHNAERVRLRPPSWGSFYNIAEESARDELRKRLRQTPLTHVFIANWPPQHLLTAFKFSEMCPGGSIVISKPLDTNFALIDTIAGGSWPRGSLQNRPYVVTSKPANGPHPGHEVVLPRRSQFAQAFFTIPA
jgi:hypothetical protein